MPPDALPVVAPRTGRWYCLIPVSRRRGMPDGLLQQEAQYRLDQQLAELRADGRAYSAPAPQFWRTLGPGDPALPGGYLLRNLDIDVWISVITLDNPAAAQPGEHVTAAAVRAYPTPARWIWCAGLECYQLHERLAADE